MDIPWQSLNPDTLRALIEEFVTRDGTDYGAHEASHERKVEQVMKMIEKGEVKIVFDSESESVDLRDAKDLARSPAGKTLPSRDSEGRDE